MFQQQDTEPTSLTLLGQRAQNLKVMKEDDDAREVDMKAEELLMDLKLCLYNICIQFISVY